MSNLAIITIDDERMILDSLRNQLEKNYKDKFILEFAESAEEALEVMDDLSHMDIGTLLVITDFLMPGMKGDELIDRLTKEFPAVNIVMLTGHVTPEISKRMVSKKLVLKIIQKPWKESDLFMVIDQLTDGAGE
jgi:CheY-like chemotaxis protein